MNCRRKMNQQKTLGTRSIQPKLIAKERNREGKWQQKIDGNPHKDEERVLPQASEPHDDSVSNELMCLSPCFQGGDSSGKAESKNSGGDKVLCLQ